MDVTKLQNIIENELKNLTPLHSLQLQNHIYGCFIIMEDIAQQVLDLTNYNLIGPKYVFDINTQFSQIGIRYGFVMDTKLTLENYSSSYKDTWLEYFNDINLTRDIELVDLIEDTLISTIQKNVKPDDSFFLNALETGSLPPEWIEKVVSIINPSLSSANSNNILQSKKSTLSNAVTEKKVIKQRKLAITRRNINQTCTTRKLGLTKTRRNYKV
jgi:hypothetical protein